MRIGRIWWWRLSCASTRSLLGVGGWQGGRGPADADRSKRKAGLQLARRSVLVAVLALVFSPVAGGDTRAHFFTLYPGDSAEFPGIGLTCAQFYRQGYVAVCSRTLAQDSVGMTITQGWVRVWYFEGTKHRKTLLKEVPRRP